MADPTPSPTPYVPQPANPATVADLFARGELIDAAREYLASKPGLLDQRISDAIAADEAALDDQIAAAIEADSAANGSPIPEIVLRTFSTGETGLYSFNAGAAAGQHLVPVLPVADFQIKLPASPAPAPTPEPSPSPPPSPSPSPALAT